MSTVWRLVTHHINTEAALRWTRREERIAIGWGDIGDIRAQGYQSVEDISEAIKRSYPKDGNSGKGGINLWDFYSTMQKGDLVILSTAARRELVVEVRGDYEWCEDGPVYGDGYNHQRLVRLTAMDPDRTWRGAGAKPASGHSPRWTLIQCERPLL